MRFILGIIIGVVSVAVYGILGGYLLIQATAERAGAVLDVSNQLVAISKPRFPLLPYLAIAVAGFALIFCFQLWSARSSALAGALIGGIIAAVVLIIFSVSIDSRYQGRPQEFAAGISGWVQYGGRNPAFYLVAVLLLGKLVQSVVARRRPA